MKALMVSILASLVLLGCASDTSQNGGRSSEGSAVATDPVSGARVHTDSPWNTTWNGHRYYFESEQNLWKFQSEPKTYVTEDGHVNRERLKVGPQGVY
jgi:YHS domain-containing protein